MRRVRRLQRAPGGGRVSGTGGGAPPLGDVLLGALPRQHWIADTRSTLGKTRTRTARDLHALGLLDAAALGRVLRERPSSGASGYSLKISPTTSR